MGKPGRYYGGATTTGEIANSLMSSFTRCVLIGSLCISLLLEPAVSSHHQSEEQHLFSRALKIQARVTRQAHPGVRGSSRHRDKREVPISTTVHPDGGHEEKITVFLPVDGKEYTLDLQLNRDLIPKGYFERTQRENKTVVTRPSYQNEDDCHYHGKVRGRPESWAALSTCEEQIRGALFDGDQLHYIEPDNDSSSSTDSTWNLLHYKNSHLTKNLTCGHDSHHKHFIEDGLKPIKEILIASDEDRHDSSPHWSNRVKRSYSSHEDTRVPYNSDAKSRYVELVIVVDNKKYKELGGDLKAVRKRTKDIANIVNSLYAPLNIFIALVGMVVWTESDEISIKANGDETLASFLHYRKERLLKEHPNDNAQLLTAVEFENGVVGKAMQGPICSYKYSGGVNSDFKNNVIGVVATTVAHELGHNFGLSHDTEGCTCPSPNNRCIMAASASSNRTMHWSTCSLKDFAYAFDHGMDYCLRNKPQRLYDGPTCGNGFTEPGEECDCGLPEHCENPCCDAHTCTMHLNATCASGTCCDMETCHVKSGGTVCREATKLCDLPEYCTGESEFCPDDVTKMDGLPCETASGKAYCYNGECRTHTDQCRLLWGPSGNNSNDLCYQKNANGSRHAHCGYNLTTEKYDRCQTEDVKCGILHCQMNSEKLEFGYESVSILASFFVNAGGKIHPCRSVIVDFGLSDINPGMVPDGAKCGEDKMCVNQKCVPVGSILGKKYPVCAYDCSGRGVCNSKGHCHCDDGYGGQYCDASGYGGSIHSGPARDPYGTSRFFKILYVTFLGFIPLIAIITFYIYYAGDYFKKLCFSIITFQAFTQNNRPSRNNKPHSNANGFRHRDISSPTQNHTSPGQSGSNPQSPNQEDFFGQYKGFSLSPIKSSPLSQPRNGGGGGGSANGATNSGVTQMNNNNNNNDINTNSANTNTNSLPTGSIQSETNANVYYSSVPKQNESVQGNSGSDRASGGFRLPNPQTGLFQSNSGSRSVTRVSWAQPIASPLPVSPGSEDESANSDTPLYENTGVEQSSPKIQKLNLTPPPGQGSPQSKLRAASSMDALDGPKPKSTRSEKKESSFSGSSAFSRLAAAIPFVRSSFRMSSSPNDGGNKSSPKGNKNFPKNVSRSNLEISKPILHTAGEQSAYRPGTPTNGDSSQGYANLPARPDENAKKPSLKNGDRFRESTPPATSDTKPFPKVQRAHSMIQPSTGSNRNSVHGGTNPNYNSLRRLRPSVPPPKPPEAPPPPPPTYMGASSFSEAKARFLQNSTTPPPVPPPNSNVLSTAPTPVSSQSPKGMRPAIAKFTFGNRSRSSSPSSSSIPAKKESPPSTWFKAPIAKVEELNSPCSPPNSNKKDKKENIYDTIDEGMIPIDLKSTTEKRSAPVKKTSTEGSSSGESSPTTKKSSRRGSEEKIETLSTGSSESNGGLLSDIISEIQSRNKESIYNSVDRRKQRREKKAALATSLLQAEKEASQQKQKQKPEITAKPTSISSLSSANKRSTLSSTSPRTPNTSSSSISSNNVDSSTPSNKCSSSPSSTRRYMSPLSNQTFSFYKRPSGPGSTFQGPTEEKNANINSSEEKQKAVLNPTTAKPATGSKSSLTPSSLPSSTPLFSSPSSTATPSTFSSSASRIASYKPEERGSAVKPVIKPKTVATPPPTSLSATTAPPTSTDKPVCAVNGVPKVTTSPSYVAKINYFSNLSQGAGSTPMKPINSIPAPSRENPAKEIIYASSNVDMSGDHSGNPPERSHYAATIRRSRPQYYNNKELDSSKQNDANSNPVTDVTNRYNNKGTYGRKSAGIYGSLGRKVPTPVIRSNSIEKEKREAQSRDTTPDRSSCEIDSEVDEIIRGIPNENKVVAKDTVDTSPKVGYKPYNSYLNRQLTFSTFRPKSTDLDSRTRNGSTSSNEENNTITAQIRAVPTKPKPIGATGNGVGVAVTTPVHLRSPNRLVK